MNWNILKNKSYFVYILLLMISMSSCKDDIEISDIEVEEDVDGFYVDKRFPSSVGTVVYESTEPANRYVSSPSILILSNGHYITSFNYKSTTRIFISKNKGTSWEQIAQLEKLNWSSLFEHNGNIYIMGTLGGWGDMVISMSKDNGYSWTVPKDENTGLLANGFFHTAPVPIVKHNGKIWRAFEEVFAKENRDFRAFAVCADENADLLKATSWKRTNSVFFENEWLNARRPNWLEGNLVITPENKLINFMRLESWPAKGINFNIQGLASGKPRHEVAAVIDIDDKNMFMDFKQTSENFIHFPGAESKFTIRYDDKTQSYWTITNKITQFVNTSDTHDLSIHQRNVLVLMSSKDLKEWEISKKILRWNEGALLKTWDSFGFQYIDWQFEQTDIVFVSRTSWYGKRYHDANMITFHRIKDFREKTNQEPEDMLQYTQVPPLIEVKAQDLKTNKINIKDFGLTINIGSGILVDENSKITLSNQQVSINEGQAIKANRYIDFIISNKKDKKFSIETLDFTTSSNSTAFRLKWMYSIDGKTFLPITNYLINIPQNNENKLATPIYLSVYEGLKNISKKQNVILRCVVVRGNGNNIYFQFNDNIIIGGKYL